MGGGKSSQSSKASLMVGMAEKRRFKIVSRSDETRTRVSVEGRANLWSVCRRVVESV